jgi:hypothetical protein
LLLQNWGGDFTITNLAAGTTVVIYGYAKVTVAASCTGGTVRHTSHVEVANSGASTVELISDATATDAIATAVADIPTVAEFEARTLVAANYATAANQITVAQIWTTAITESYRATGATGTGAQLFYEILANLINFGNVGTTKTITDLAGSPVKTYTYDSAASPTAIEEST